MRILIDIGHPGHVHLFKHFAHEMIKSNHEVLFTVRDKEFEVKLLEHEKFNFINFGKHYKSKIGKVFGLAKFSFLSYKTSLKFKPDIYLSHGSMYNAIASYFYRKPHIAFEDTGNIEQVRLYKPFTETILTSTTFKENYGSKQLRYRGCHELAYLHPNYFTPNDSIFNKLGLKLNDSYFILRFVSWNATHDVGQKGLTLTQKRELIELLNRFGKVFISSEGDLPAEFNQYQIKINPEDMHDALACAKLFIGEGATMASECAVLGTPAVYVNTMEAGSIDEQEEIGLLYHYRNGNGVVEKVKTLLEDKDLNVNARLKSTKFIEANINVTKFLIWFINNYPDSRTNYTISNNQY